MRGLFPAAASMQAVVAARGGAARMILSPRTQPSFHACKQQQPLLHTTAYASSGQWGSLGARLAAEEEDKTIRTKAGRTDLYAALSKVDSGAELDEMAAVVASYRRLNKKVSPRVTRMVVDACTGHNRHGLAAEMMLDKKKYGMFPRVDEYNTVMAGLLADPAEAPATAVAVFERLLLDRNDDADAESFDLAINACTLDGTAPYLAAAADLVETVVHPHNVAIGKERYAGLAAALVHPDVSFSPESAGADAAAKVLCAGGMSAGDAEAEVAKLVAAGKEAVAAAAAAEEAAAAAAGAAEEEAAEAEDGDGAESEGDDAKA